MIDQSKQPTVENKALYYSRAPWVDVLDQRSWFVHAPCDFTLSLRRDQHLIEGPMCEACWHPSCVRVRRRGKCSNMSRYRYTLRNGKAQMYCRMHLVRVCESIPERRKWRWWANKNKIFPAWGELP